MLASLWFTFLYQPVFNALILIYSTIAQQNLGWAVIWLTIFLRILLLPFTIISERNQLHRQKGRAEAEAAIKAYRNDAVAQREAARKIMRKYRISPWAKVITLAIQAVVFILLYQVFIRGISGEKVVKILYPSVNYPGPINTVFYGFEIGRTHDVLWAGIVAVYLFISIFLANRRQRVWQKSEMYFMIFFPIFTFAALWYLPMVKSLFILTTMLFSDSISLLRLIFFSPKKASA
jgi:YidC/Oxa1 family membrane protein insertase